MRKQKLFAVEWSGHIENDWQLDSITAANFADAEQKAMASIYGIQRIKAITDTGQQVYAEQAA